MKVFKFGGASVKDAEAVRNVAKIISSHKNGSLFVVISAMGKTTNALEKLLDAHFYKKGNTEVILKEIKDFHFDILKQLFKDTKHPIYQEIHNTFVEVEWQLEDEPVGSYDFEYDQMVTIGEMLSSKIVNAYLNLEGIASKWWDVRDLIRTDNTYRAAKVDWEISEKLIKNKLLDFLQDDHAVGITQGFVGGTSENFNSTLGREGSDFSAAIFANILDAEELIIWKDVEGMLNADPKFFEQTSKLNNISYLEAVELAYYGASVIHPKTIKPLENKHIPLYVKSFLKPEEAGSLINSNTASDSLIPSYIFKKNQLLLSISTRDYSFVDEKSLGNIFKCFSELGISINLMQNSAISFSVCMDFDQAKFDSLIQSLEDEFKLSYNTEVELLTVRHYDEETLAKLSKGKQILVEQKSRNTARLVLKP